MAGAPGGHTSRDAFAALPRPCSKWLSGDLGEGFMPARRPGSMLDGWRAGREGGADACIVNSYIQGETMKKFKAVLMFVVMAGLLFMGPGKMMVGTALAAPQTKCPILDGDIDKKLYTDYKGKRIYFCCSACVEKFKSNPEKYLKEMKAAGITPEKTPSK